MLTGPSYDAVTTAKAIVSVPLTNCSEEEPFRKGLVTVFTGCRDKIVRKYRLLI